MTQTFSLTAYRKLFRYLLISLAASILLSAAYLIATKLAGVDRVQPLYEDALARKYELPVRILLIAIIIPILEELGYRAYLIYRPINLAISGGLIISVQILSESHVLDGNPYKLLIILGAFLAVSPLIYLAVKRDEQRERLVERFWINNQKLIFYATVFIFAATHLLTFGFAGKQFFFIPLFILPYIVISYYLCKIRLELGLIWSIQLHMLINLAGCIQYFY
jgi:membrane protease YdiL (CAAX protease family)